MQRRNFLQAAAALVAAMGMPELRQSNEPCLARFRLTGVIEDQHIVLRETLVIDNRFSEVNVRRCTFETAKGFKGDSLFLLEGDKYATFSDCCFDMKHAGFADFCRKSS